MKEEKVVAILLGRLELKLKADSNTGGWIVLEALTCCWNCGLLCLSVAVLSFSMSRTSSIAGVVTCSVQWKECFCVWFTLFYYRVCHHSSRTTNLKRRVGVSDWEKKSRKRTRCDEGCWSLFFLWIPSSVLSVWPPSLSPSLSLHNLHFKRHITPSLSLSLPPPQVSLLLLPSLREVWRWEARRCIHIHSPVLKSEYVYEYCEMFAFSGNLPWPSWDSRYQFNEPRHGVWAPTAAWAEIHLHIYSI